MLSKLNIEIRHFREQKPEFAVVMIFFREILKICSDSNLLFHVLIFFKFSSFRLSKKGKLHYRTAIVLRSLKSDQLFISNVDYSFKISCGITS